MPDDPRRAVPRTDAMLADPRLVAAGERLGRARVKQAVAAGLESVRAGRVAPDDAADAIVAALPRSTSSLTPVLNATGVVLHTNLGRAPLSAAARRAVADAAGYVDVEYDLDSGRRSARGAAAVAALRDAVPGAGDAMIVNNGAAALVLATTTFAAGRELIVSRGELVEIGDGFRLPDLIESTGARIHEVGTTNRVTVDDYATAVNDDTGAILKVHPSNFRISGFTSSVPVAQLVGLDVPVLADVGSGLLTPHPSLPDEPDVASAVRDGAAVVTASGDKLLGGPQAGLVLGSSDAISRMRRHPLARALRVDKLTLAALEATLIGPVVPTWQSLTADADELRSRSIALAELVGGKVVASTGAVGGGCAPGVDLAGYAIALPQHYASLLRGGVPPVITRVEQGHCLVDLRCIPPLEDAAVREAIMAVSASGSG